MQQSNRIGFQCLTTTLRSVRSHAGRCCRDRRPGLQRRWRAMHWTLWSAQNWCFSGLSLAVSAFRPQGMC